MCHTDVMLSESCKNNLGLELLPGKHWPLLWDNRDEALLPADDGLMLEVMVTTAYS